MPAGAASPRADDALVAALAAHVTPRDRAICEALYEHRVLTATQLAQLHFNSLERARKRLTILHQLWVLERFRPHRDQGSHPYHYLLDRLGAQLVAAERGLDLADLDWTRAKTLRATSGMPRSSSSTRRSASPGATSTARTTRAW
jgi:hypothetical protein